MAILLDVGLEADAWRAVNDGVMGGVSSGELVVDGEHLRFRGRLSLENNGGFASVRRLLPAAPSAATGVRLNVRGDGRRYQFRLRHDDGFDGVSWAAQFDTDGSWQTIDLPFTEFAAVFRGRPVADAGPVRPGRIRQIGFLIADGREGPFALEIAGIEFTSAASAD